MARDESTAVGGYWATPPECIADIAAMCACSAGDAYSVVDPCAADGAAAVAFARCVFGALDDVSLYAVELEASRYRRLAALSAGKDAAFTAHRLHALNGDAFAVEWRVDADHGGRIHDGASVLFLNPPYDLGRLEARFLERYTGALCIGGVLVLLVPYTALARCADTLARHYTLAGCYKLAEPLFSQDPQRAFKQVVLYATRRTSLLDADAAVVARVTKWSQDAATIHVLPVAGTARAIVTIPAHTNTGFAEWRLRPVDTDGVLARMRPFCFTDRAGVLRDVSGIAPGPMADLLCRRYPVASPMKPAFIATAIAAGVFNGALITADDTAAGWPDLLVKGTFTREFVEVDEKTNKDGEKTASIRVQQPRLSVTVLDLRSGRYHTLVDSDEESDAATVDRLTTADLLAIYGASLLRVMLANCPVLHDPTAAAHAITLADVARPLYQAQRHAVMALVKLLGGDKPIVVPQRTRYRGRKSIAASVMATAVRRHYAGRTAVLLGEVGSGKSSCALATMKTIAMPVLARDGRFVGLVFCPPHLLKSWRDQCAAVVPEARVVFLDSIAAVDALASDTTAGLTVAVLSRETAKLGHAWVGVGCDRHLLGYGRREGFGFTTRRAARARMSLRLDVQAIDDAGEVWAAVEESHDGATWRLLAAFDEVTAPGTWSRDVSPTVGALYVRIAYSASAPATFAVLDDAAAQSTCPRCGNTTPRPDKAGADHREELARKRARCARASRMAGDRLSTAARLLAETLLQAYPHAPEVTQPLAGRWLARLVERAQSRMPIVDGTHVVTDAQRATVDAAWQQARRDARLRTALDLTVAHRCRRRSHAVAKDLDYAIGGLLWALGDDDTTAAVAMRLYAASVTGDTARSAYGYARDVRDTARGFLLMMQSTTAQDAARVTMLATGVDDKPEHAYGYQPGYQAPWRRWESDRDAIVAGTRAVGYGDGIGAAVGVVTWRTHVRGDGACAVEALAKLSQVGHWTTPAPCDEPLYMAHADPQRGGRRVALAKYIAARHRRMFDMLVLDEAHEAANGSTSAQGAAAWLLAGMGLPVLAMTGTAMGGYAEQLFSMSQALDPTFRDEFARNERGLFVDRYGYVKVQERDVNRDTGKVVAYGSVSDRVERDVRIVGPAPGVLPLYMLRYLLRFSVILHKADLALELPPCREIAVTIDPGDELRGEHDRLLKELQCQIKADRFSPILAGKLWGALCHFATDYPLLASADTGNATAQYEIRYPSDRDLGVDAGRVIALAPGQPKDRVLPIEQWMIDTVRTELAEGRRCMVLASSAVLLPRLRRLLERHLGEPVVYLQANKVDTGSREQWIVDNVVTPRVRCMVVNPEAIQTGLNPLVWFSTELWMQNPGCRAITRRQAVGRVDRIGQTAQETRIYSANYDLGPANAAYTLWMHKVAVSLATDGLDAAGALSAAGVGGDDGGRLDGFAVGKLIHDLMTGARQFKTRKHASTTKDITP